MSANESPPSRVDLSDVGREEAGYAMAGLLVLLACMAILASVAMPIWRTMEQREREEELVFRGRQYTHAIELYQRKFANAFPPSVDALVEQKFLRRKYTDPVNRNAEFQAITQAQLPQLLAKIGQSAAAAGGASSPGTNPPASRTSASIGNILRGGTVSAQPTGTSSGGLGSTTSGVGGAVVGVVSKSGATSIRTFNGRTVYNEWLFVYSQPQGRGSGAGRGAGAQGRGAGGRGAFGPATR
jgi:type II secretory pathway pseudopilin PulG